MEVPSRRRAEVNVKERDASPERTKVWMEPKPMAKERKVPVVYYLSRNGHFEHPHFMEISIPCGEGLYLRDVIKRLVSLRGEGMASMYSWSSKRSYRNGFVWHDLTEEDFIYPSHGNEYILKGSELLHADSSSRGDEPLESPQSVRDDSYICRNRTARSNFGLHEYKVYKNKLSTVASMENMDACTQTEDRRQKAGHRSHVTKDDHGDEEEKSPVTELGRDEISPPSSTSSSETMEALIKADGSIVPMENVGNSTSRRKVKAPASLMQLITCGSISVKERGVSLVSHLKGRMPGVMAGDGVKGSEGVRGIGLEDKEYFSGSLIETKQKQADACGEFLGLRRSTSCNAERGSKMELSEKEIDDVSTRCIPRKKMELSEKEIDDVSTRCIPRKLKPSAVKKDADSTEANSASESRSAHDETLRN